MGALRGVRPRRHGQGISLPLLPAPADAYRDFLRDLKARVLSARVQAARAVTRELVLLYWDMGRSIPNTEQSLWLGHGRGS